MKGVVAVFVALVLGLSMVAAAAQPGAGAGDNPPQPTKPIVQPAKPGAWRVPGWPPGFQRSMMLSGLAYAAGGGYAYLDRLTFTKDQEEALGAIWDEWWKKVRTAVASPRTQVPPLTGADAQDPDKQRARQAQRGALIAQELGKFPVDKLAEVLTPEQAAKIAEMDKVAADWVKWLDEYIAGYEKKLDAAVGPAAPAGEAGDPARYGLFDSYAKGASSLARRLGLTKEQDAALETLQKEKSGSVVALYGRLAPLFHSDKGWDTQLNETRQAMVRLGGDAQNDGLRQALEKLLTDDQRNRIARARPILEERDKGLWDKWKEHAAAADKVLPRAKKPMPRMFGPGGVMVY